MGTDISVRFESIIPCTNMAQIVKPYPPQSVLLQEYLTVIRHIARSDQIAHHIHADILRIVKIVRQAHDTLHFLLPFTFPQKFFLHQRNQR